MEKSNKTIAQIISVIFHPLLLPTYALVILFNSDTHYAYMPFETKRLLYILVFLCTFLIPISIIPFLINLKIVSGVHLKNHRERIIPLIICTLSYYFAYYLLNRLPISTMGFIKTMILASAILIFLSLLISIKWKISIHLIGIGGFLAGILFYAVHFSANFTYLIIITSLLAGVNAYARLSVNAHNEAQIYSGFLLGFFGMLTVMYLGV